MLEITVKYYKGHPCLQKGTGGMAKRDKVGTHFGHKLLLRQWSDGIIKNKEVTFSRVECREKGRVYGEIRKSFEWKF